MNKRYFQQLADARRRPVDFVTLLAPWHLGACFAYASNSLTIGSMVAAGFLLLTLIWR